jgi:predicted RNA polymerase sigma factor
MVFAKTTEDSENGEPPTAEAFEAMDRFTEELVKAGGQSGAWLMVAAKRRTIDTLRRDKPRERKHEEFARARHETVDGRAEAIEAAMDDDLGDALLGLIFTGCHRMLSPDARAALTVRVVGGLTTDEPARAFLTSGATIVRGASSARRRRSQRPD